MHLALSLSPSLSTELRMSAEMRLKVETKLNKLMMSLISAVRGEKYKSEAECPKCSRKLKPLEILKGFSDDPTDFRTTCPKCGERFSARLVCRDATGSISVAFYCPSQTLDQLRSHVAPVVPQEFKRTYPNVYRSAIVHFGSLGAAFKEIGVAYHHKEVGAWKEKVKPFLGELPDAMIARIVEKSVSVVRRLRVSLGIATFRKSDAVT